MWVCEQFLLPPETAQPLIGHLLAARDRSHLQSRALLQFVPVPCMQLTRDTLCSVNAQLSARECDALEQLLTFVDASDTSSELGSDTCHTPAHDATCP